MKKLGIVIIVLGILLTVFSGISFKREETIVELGEIELTQEKEDSVDWPRWAGIAAIGAGLVIFLVARKGK